jgi:hypothetical protein
MVFNATFNNIPVIPLLKKNIGKNAFGLVQDTKIIGFSTEKMF